MTTAPSDPPPSSQQTPSQGRPPFDFSGLLKSKKTWIALACLATLALIFWAFKAISAETMLVVSCDQIKGGYVCKLTPSGARALDSKVCWEIHDICENGVKSMVSKCVRDTLEPGREIRALIANSEFSNYSSCDKISRREIESLYMEKVREAPVSAQK